MGDTETCVKQKSPMQRQWVLYYSKLKIAYNYIPKNACSTIKRSLTDAEGGWTYKKSPHELDETLSVCPEECDDSWTRIVVIRDPFARFISAYLDKIVRPNELRHKIMMQEAFVQAHKRQPIGDENITIAEFFDWVQAQPRESLDAHWRPQALLMTYAKYDHIIRVENLNEDWVTSGLASKIPLKEFKGHATSSDSEIDRMLLGIPGNFIYGYRITTGAFPSKKCFADPVFEHRVRSFYAEDGEIFERKASDRLRAQGS